MPKYKLHAACYLDNRHLPAGSVVEFEGNPGSQMEPLDAAAWEAFHKYAAERSRSRQAPVTRYPFKVIERSATELSEPAEIPDDWKDRGGLALSHLARKLGAPRSAKAPEQRAFIEAEVAKRAAAESVDPAQPVNPVRPSTSPRPASHGFQPTSIKKE